MVYCLLVLFAWVACIGAACWLDLSSQKHIESGLDNAWITPDDIKQHRRD